MAQPATLGSSISDTQRLADADPLVGRVRPALPLLGRLERAETVQSLQCRLGRS